MQTRALDVVLRVPPHQSSGIVQLESVTPQERRKRAARRVVICWALAIVSYYIPVAHFLLVPGFFLFGPGLAFLVYNARTVIVSGEGTCPHCQAPFEVVKGAVEWPYFDICDKCHARVQIDPAKPE